MNSTFGVSEAYPDSFPPRRYWTSSLAEPWWLRNLRRAGLRQPQENPPFANFTRGYQTEYTPDHLFQVPCDTITPSSERYQRTGQIEIIR